VLAIGVHSLLTIEWALVSLSLYDQLVLITDLLGGKYAEVPELIRWLEASRYQAFLAEAFLKLWPSCPLL
jgi:hypothetical protein